jgi:hypothetical protein
VEFLKISSGEGFHVGASGLTELHETFAFELEEGFTNGDSTNAKAISNGRFCEEIAGGEIAEKDFAAEVGCSGFGSGERWKGRRHSVYRFCCRYLRDRFLGREKAGIRGVGLCVGGA